MGERLRGGNRRQQPFDIQFAIQFAPDLQMGRETDVLADQDRHPVASRFEDGSGRARNEALHLDPAQSWMLW